MQESTHQQNQHEGQQQRRERADAEKCPGIRRQTPESPDGFGNKQNKRDQRIQAGKCRRPLLPGPAAQDAHTGSHVENALDDQKNGSDQA